MRILVALDTSEISENAAVAMARWSQDAHMDVDLLSVIHPDEIHSKAERSDPGEFLQPDNTEPGHVPAVGGSQYGEADAVVGEPAPRTVEYRGQALARARAEREEYLRSLATEHFSDRMPGLHVEFAEDTAETVVAVAETLGADAIAIGTHGRTGIRHALMGSVAEEVTRRSPVPVIVVGPAAEASEQPAAG